MKIGILGASGKMGQAVIRACEKLDLQYVSYSRSAETSKEQVFASSDVIIDFSHHLDAIANINLAEKFAKPILIGTTGHSDPQALVSSKIALLCAPNTCLEWNMIKNAVQNLARNNPDFVVTVDDIHAATKKDAPSGTAKDLAQGIESDVSIRSVRKTNLASWHRISLYDTEQVIHLEHQVLNREVYAAGAIKLAQKLVGMVPGTYSVGDLQLNL